MAQPLVLLHAFPLDSRLWARAGEHVHGADLVIVDLPGFGDSALPDGEPSLDTSADAVAAVLDRAGIARAVVAGVSMGGYVALALARRHPDRLSGLALIDSRADADSDEARANRFRVAQAVLGPQGAQALAPMVDVLLGATSHARRPDVVEQVRTWLAAAPPQGVAWAQKAMAARPDSRDLLARIAVPAAVVVGEEDAMTPPSLARDVAAGLPDAVLTVVPEAGHLSPLERPDAVAAALMDLLVRVR